MSRNDPLNAKCWTEVTVSYGNDVFLYNDIYVVSVKYHFLNMSVSEYIVHVGQMMYLLKDLIYILCFSLCQ